MNKVAIVVKGASLGVSFTIHLKKQGYKVIVFDYEDDAISFCDQVNMSHFNNKNLEYIVGDPDDKTKYESVIRNTLDQYGSVDKFFVCERNEDGLIDITRKYLMRNFKLEGEDIDECQVYIRFVTEKYCYRIIDHETLNAIRSDLKSYLVHREMERNPVTYKGNIVNNFHLHVEHQTGRIELIPETL